MIRHVKRSRCGSLCEDRDKDILVLTKIMSLIMIDLYIEIISIIPKLLFTDYEKLVCTVAVWTQVDMGRWQATMKQESSTSDVFNIFKFSQIESLL